MISVRLLRRWINLAKRRLNGCSNPRGDLNVLPLELIIEITEYLPEASVIAFALSCRVFYNLIICKYPMCRFPKLNRRNREELLLLLEKDLGHLYFCHTCVELHAWKHSWDINKLWDSPKAPPCIAAYMFSPKLYLQANLPYPLARVIMNRHFYGDKHGLALKKLTQTSTPYIWSDGTNVRSSSQGYIVGDDLYLIHDCRIWQKHGKAPELRQFIDGTEVRICPHICLGREMFSSDSRIPQLNQPATEPAPFSPLSNAVGSCPTCQTDYSLSITYEGEKRGWIIAVRVYQQFGSCRSPHDWTWRHMAEESELNQPRSVAVGPGMLRYWWGCANEEGVVGLEGEFVGEPRNKDSCIPGPRRCPWQGLGQVHGRDHDCATYESESEGGELSDAMLGRLGLD